MARAKPDLTDVLSSRTPRPAEASQDPAPIDPTLHGRPLIPMDPASIIVPEGRLRSVDPLTVQQLVESVSSIGLQSPISVRPNPDDTGTCILVTGAHRLEAIRALEWPLIDTLLIDGSEQQIRLIEVSENLIRKELTRLGRARSLREYKHLCIALGTAPSRGGDQRPPDKSGNEATPSWANKTGEILGLALRTVDRAVKIADGIPDPLAEALEKTPIANREGDLFLLTQMPADEQDDILHRLQEAQSPPNTLKDILPPADPPPPTDPSSPANPSPPGAEGQLQRLDRFWESSDPGTREQFIASLTAEPGTREQIISLLVEGGWIDPERTITNAGPPDAD